MPANTGLIGKVAFITGATRGIGNSIANAFYEEGAVVIGSGSKSNENFKYGDYYKADFSDLRDINRCADFVKSLKPDVLVNCAGINKNSPFAEIELEEFQKIQQVNVTAPLILSQAAVHGMQHKGWGRIVNISSVWGKISKANRAAYSASKFALDGITLAFSLEYAKYGILANCIAPGFTDTALTRSAVGAVELAEIISSIPLGRMAKTSEIAKFALWLGSPENTYITGQNIAIDGGFTRA